MSVTISVSVNVKAHVKLYVKFSKDTVVRDVSVVTIFSDQVDAFAMVLDAAYISKLQGKFL